MSCWLCPPCCVQAHQKLWRQCAPQSIHWLLYTTFKLWLLGYRKYEILSMFNYINMFTTKCCRYQLPELTFLPVIALSFHHLYLVSFNICCDQITHCANTIHKWLKQCHCLMFGLSGKDTIIDVHIHLIFFFTIPLVHYFTQHKNSIHDEQSNFKMTKQKIAFNQHTMTTNHTIFKHTKYNFKNQILSSLCDHTNSSI